MIAGTLSNVGRVVATVVAKIDQMRANLDS